MHFPNKKSMEQALSLLELFERTAQKVIFHKKIPQKITSWDQIITSIQWFSSNAIQIHFQPSDLLSSQKWNLDTSSPCSAPPGSDATLSTLPPECAQLSVSPAAAVGYSRGSDGWNRSGIDLLASQYSHSVPFITNSLTLINF